MLWVILILLIVIVVLVPVINILLWKIGSPTPFQNTLCISHRGAGGLAPENTLEAIDQGLKHAADYLEIDIHQTLDNQIVVIHDASINRTTNGAGLIRNMNYAELEKFNASKSLPGYFNVTKIPLLTEVLEKIISNDSKLMVEIKDPQLYPGMIERMAKIIIENNAEDRVIIFSFNQNSIAEVKKYLPNVPTGLLYVGLEKLDHSLKSNFIAPCWITVLYAPFIVKKYHSKGYKIFVWTVDSQFFMRYLIGKKVDGIITNRPDRLKNSLLN